MCFVVTYRYNLRLEAMLQKEEFQITLETIEPTIEALKGAIEGGYRLSLILKSTITMKNLITVFIRFLKCN